MHKEPTPLLFSRLEWIRIGWLAFEFKFDLNSSEQPPSFILSHGEDVAKMQSCTILKREEKVGCVYDFLREKGWREKGPLHEKRKEKKRKEKKRERAST